MPGLPTLFLQECHNLGNQIRLNCPTVFPRRQSVRTTIDCGSAALGHSRLLPDSAWLPRISNPRHKNRAQNVNDDSGLEQHGKQRKIHPTNFATECLAAQPNYRLTNNQCN